MSEPAAVDFHGIDGWGTINCKIARGHGPMLLVRADGYPLLPEHVKTLCDFCTKRIRPKVAKVREKMMHSEGFVKVSRQGVLLLITRAAFASYWRKYKSDMVEKHGAMEWQNLPSPYEIHGPPRKQPLSVQNFELQR